MKNRFALILGLFAVSLMQAQQSVLVNAARDFLRTLDQKQNEEAVYAFDDDERFDWDYVPRSREGVSFRVLSASQREAALALLKASVSEQGYTKATAIIELEGVLREMEGRRANDPYRDPLNYSFTLFGTPAEGELWGWRLEGHHLSLNFSSLSGEIVSGTPAFWGTNPAVVPRGPHKGKQILKKETELGFKLVNSLSAQQLRRALIDEDAPPDIITGDSRTAEFLEPPGIAYAELNNDQQIILTELLETYTKNYTDKFSLSLMEKVKKRGMEKLHFAWAGSLTPGSGHYYRIQSPALLIEYDNTQNNANHVHAVVRDLTNDFGRDVLREHYKIDHGK